MIVNRQAMKIAVPIPFMDNAFHIHFPSLHARNNILVDANSNENYKNIMHFKLQVTY